MEEVLVLKGLTKYYGKTKGIKDLSFSLKKGEIFGLIGPNGSGKSTTIRLIMNLLNPDDGEVMFHYESLDKNKVELKKKIGYLPSEINLYDDMKVKSLFDFHMSFYKEDLRSKRENLVKRLEIDESKKIEDLSLGNKKKVGIVLALMHNPDLIILDEPTSGLDPIAQQVFYQLLLEEKLNGKTILYSTHILSEISVVCDRVGIIRNGELISIENVYDLYKQQLNVIVIDSEDIDNIIKELGIEEYKRVDNAIQFKNTIEAQQLIQTLSHYKINHLLIEEVQLEEMLLHYYR